MPRDEIRLRLGRLPAIPIFGSMKRLIEICIRDYAWIHTTIGLLGNIAFVAGSLLFLDQQQHHGTLFFITGSVGMLIGNLGNAVVMAIERRWKHERERRGVAPR